MKKFLIFISCVAIALIVSSCKKDPLTIDPNTLDNVTYKCWYVTVTQSASGNQATSSWYVWTHERALVISLQKNKDVPGYSARYKEDTRFAGQYSCEEANEKDK